MDLGMAAGLSLLVAGAGWRWRGLTAAGAGVAVLVGTAILTGTGWPGMAALAAFFAGSTVISRLAPDRSVELLDAKGHQRDPWQVLANGGAAAVGALLDFVLSGAGLWVVTTSLAAAAADTWATSIGGWSRSAPRHVLRGTPVPPGTSGGVTWAGTAGAAAGALTVATAAALLGAPAALFPVAFGVGMLGMLADSVLGATLQGRFHCPTCARPTERRVHRCGTPAVPTGGLAWLTNDGVNAVATGLAALAGLAVWWIFP